MYPLWRHYYRIAKMQDNEFYVSSKDFGGHSPPYQLFNSKKEAIKLARTATKENFYPLYKLITYWIVTGLYLILFFLSPFIIGKFINGGLMDLYIPYPASGYIAGTIVAITSLGCLASKRFHGLLNRIEEMIQGFIFKD